MQSTVVKKLIILFISTCFVLTLVPVSAFAENYMLAENTDGEITAGEITATVVEVAPVEAETGESTSSKADGSYDNETFPVATAEGDGSDGESTPEATAEEGARDT